MVIEAVFEDINIKHKVIKEVEEVCATSGFDVHIIMKDVKCYIV